MRILTVRPPWAQLIVHHGKDVENRVRNIAGGYRGPVAIHVGLRALPAGDPAWWAADQAGMDTDRYDGEELNLGHIIGVVDLTDVHRATRHYEPIEGTPWVMECTDRPCCQPWGQREQEHLVLANPRPLAEPIPYKGALGLRNLAVNDPATTARILAQIGDPQ